MAIIIALICHVHLGMSMFVRNRQKGNRERQNARMACFFVSHHSDIQSADVGIAAAALHYRNLVHTNADELREEVALADEVAEKLRLLCST